MFKRRRITASFGLAGICASSLWAIAPTGAQAAGSIPTLQWPEEVVGERFTGISSTSVAGSITLPCESYTDTRDLQTYSTTGQVVRQINGATQIDGLPNCIIYPETGKDGNVYGIPWGKDASGNYRFGPNLLAYDGNTLKWKYPVSCASDTSVTVGADGNIYALAQQSDGLHLIGLKPDVQAPQTQPTKVFDVKVPSDCSIELHAYKDGIMFHGQSSGWPKYYSYSGKYLGEATVRRLWEQKINSSGQLFVPEFTSGTPRTVKVSMFDPRRGKVIWIEQASTLNADAQQAWLQPLPNGGVVALIREQKMDAGAPSMPIEYIHTLVTMNALGQKIKTQTFLNSDSSGNTFEAPEITAQVNGKVLVVRPTHLITDYPGQPRADAISIGVYDPVTGTWGYQEVMKGNTQQPADLYGFKADSYRPVAGTVYVVASKCTPWSCARKEQKMYALAVPGSDLDYPRGAVLKATFTAQPAPRSYVAMGDSFSGAEGVPDFDDDGTTCHRSVSAYSRQLWRNPSLSVRLDQFVACSGAQTTHVLNGWFDADHNEAAQVNVLLLGPKVATITIGGNDIFFGPFGRACVLSTCNLTSSVYQDSLNAINTTLGGRLEATYKKMLEVSKAAGTKIYVLGYPDVVANKAANAPYDIRCGFMYDFNRTPSDPWQEARAARDITTKLNAKIIASVNAVRAINADNKRLTFVSATASGSPFATHEMCSTGVSYFQNLDQYPANNAAPLHPNEDGQAAYAQLVRQALGE